MNSRFKISCLRINNLGLIDNNNLKKNNSIVNLQKVIVIMYHYMLHKTYSMH